MAGLKLVQATARINLVGTGVVWPANATTKAIKTPSMLVTAGNSNTGTVFLTFHSTHPQNWMATRRRSDCVPLTRDQSISFTGIHRGSSGVQDLHFGTGYSYMLTGTAGATQRLICTYYEYVE